MEFLEYLSAERMHITSHLLYEHESRYGIAYLEEYPREQDSFTEDSIARNMTCCFTGHRPEKMHRSYPESLRLLCASVMDAYDAGYRIFISGMSRGIDLWAAHIMIVLRSLHPDIRLVAAIPFPAFDQKWNIEEQHVYQALLAQADLVCTISKIRTARSFQFRNMWMVDHSSRLIACWDGEPGGTANTIQYAKRKDIQIIML